MDIDPCSPDVDRETLLQAVRELHEYNVRLKKLAEAKEKTVRLLKLRGWQVPEEFGEPAQAHDPILGPPSSNKSPLQSLPDELLLNIFALVPGWNQIHTNFTAGWRISLPGAALMLVCCRWRRLALSCPLLWSHIHYNISSLDNSGECSEDVLARPTELLSLVLARSNNYPLDIQLCVDWTEDDPPPSLALLWSTCRRWRSLRIDDDLMDLEMLEPCPLPCHLPLLEEASFATDHEKIQQLVPGAPNLQFAAFLPFTWTPTAPSYAYGHTLSRLTCVALGTAAWRDILDVLPCIEVVILRLDDHDYYSKSTVPFTLPATVLTLVLDRSIDRDILADALKCLRAPSIKHFRLTVGQITRRARGHEDPVAFPIHELTEFFIRSKCRLSYFSLEDVPIRRQELDALVKNLPIQNVDADYRVNGSGTVEGLTVNEGTRKFR